MNGQPAAPAPKRRGCLFYGCLIFAIIGVILLVMSLMALRFAKKFVDQWTDTKPMALPVVKLSDEQLATLRARMAAFQQSVTNTAAPAEPLTLTGDELNGLIESDPNWKNLKGKVYLGITNNLVSGEVSLPLTDSGVPYVKNRYVNGAGTFDVSFRDGKLYLSLKSLKVKDTSMPEDVLQKVSNGNLAQNANDDPNLMKTFRDIESIEVKDGKIIIVPKQKK